MAIACAGPAQRHHVAARPRVDAEPALDQREILVELAAELRGEAVVVEDEVDLLDLLAAARLAAARFARTFVARGGDAGPTWHQANSSTEPSPRGEGGREAAG